MKDFCTTGLSVSRIAFNFAYGWTDRNFSSGRYSRHRFIRFKFLMRRVTSNFLIAYKIVKCVYIFLGRCWCFFLQVVKKKSYVNFFLFIFIYFSYNMLELNE